MPFLCGGGLYGFDKCFKYEAAFDTWDILGTLAMGRSYAGFSSSDSWGLVMAGGVDPELNYLSSVETTADGEVFGALPDLPEETSFFCQVVVDDDRIFACGGRSMSAIHGSRSTNIFSKQADVWTRQAQIINNRAFLSWIDVFQHVTHASKKAQPWLWVGQ